MAGDEFTDEEFLDGKLSPFLGISHEQLRSRTPAPIPN